MTTTIDPGDLPERFAPETVDDEIARYLSTEPQPTPSADDTRLIHEIAAYHALPPEIDASLARVRARLRASSQVPSDSNSSRRGDTIRGTANVDTRAWQSQAGATSSRIRRLTLLPAPLRAVAAVLVVTLLVAAFVAVFHLPGARQTATAPTWQNVAITQEKAQGYTLDFVPAQVDVEYAISDVDGAIYAYGTPSQHIWYSVDGGATYRPFALSLPLVKGWSYAISTVPGLPGVFLSSGAQPFETIYYAEVGDKSWRQLNTSTVAQSLTPNGTSVAFDATNIGKAIFFEHEFGKSVQARAVSNWLFVLAKRSNGGDSTLIGTPDFGTTWYVLHAGLPGACAQFAVNPADARQLYCLTNNNTVEQTADGGKTWKQMVSVNSNAIDPSTSIWASPRAVYSYATTVGTNKVTLAQHPVGAGNWSAVATLPNLPQGGGSQIIGVSPDDTAYAVAALGGQQTRVQISVLPPGERQFASVGNEATLTFPGPGSAIFFDLGDVYSGKAPAVYVHTGPEDFGAGARPLYRLALPAANTPPQPVATPFLTPTSLPTATLALHGACTSTPGDVANIQSGGYGADLDTFAQRWGPSDGVAAGSVYFGRWTDSTPKVQVADAMPSNHRVYAMGYHLSQAENMTQAQGEALAASILPKDVTPIARTQQGNDVTVTYCSAALIAAFPASVYEVNGPLPHNGLVIVTYTLRTDGHLFGIGFGPLP